MKKLILVLMIVFGCNAIINAQSMGSSYKSALGVKFYPGAISFKTFVKNNNALEFNGYFWKYGTRITGLYEFYGDINNAPGLKWYAGVGAHIGFWNDTWKNAYPGRETGTAIGVDGVIGLDYKISGAPINVSLDWQPSFNFVGYSYFESGWGGLAFRYTF